MAPVKMAGTPCTTFEREAERRRLPSPAPDVSEKSSSRHACENSGKARKMKPGRAAAVVSPPSRPLESARGSRSCRRGFLARHTTLFNRSHSSNTPIAPPRPPRAAAVVVSVLTGPPGRWTSRYDQAPGSASRPGRARPRRWAPSAPTRPAVAARSRKIARTGTVHSSTHSCGRA